MKKIIFSILIPAMMLIASCSPKAVVSDEELAMIFRDAFLANAYLYDKGGIKIDTMQVYQPIFDKYGYTAEEVAVTVGSFSRRKSARLGDVVERAIVMLEQGEEYYKKESAILDSIDALARRTLTREYYSDSLITYYSVRDTVDVYMQFDSLKPGDYDISFDYLVDSLDDNGSNYRFVSWIEDPNRDLKNPRRGSNTSYLRRKYVSSVDRHIKVDTMTHELHLRLLDSYEHKRKPHVTIKNFKIDYTPVTAEAVDSLFKMKLDIRLFANDFFNLPAQDSVELPAI